MHGTWRKGLRGERKGGDTGREREEGAEGWKGELTERQTDRDRDNEAVRQTERDTDSLG